MKRITEESLSKLSKTKLPLVIYGAGGVSNVCMERLLYLGIEVECVAVTNIKTNPSVVFGKRVYSVDDVLKKYQNFLVVVCVLEDKQKEIYNLLALKGIDVSNIFFMTDELYFGWQKENVEVALNNKDVSYYKRYTEPYIKTLNRICQEREYSIDEARRFIDKGLDILEDNEVCMARLVIVLSTKCSLKCVECNNLIPHFQPQRDLDANVILRSIEMITQSVGKILKCELIGGEPFMSKNLEVVLREILINVLNHFLRSSLVNFLGNMGLGLTEKLFVSTYVVSSPRTLLATTTVLAPLNSFESVTRVKNRSPRVDLISVLI